MSLFDDLLNQTKPAQTGSGKGSSQQDDPLATTPIIISATTLLGGVDNVVGTVQTAIPTPIITPIADITEENNAIIFSSPITPEVTSGVVQEISPLISNTTEEGMPVITSTETVESGISIDVDATSSDQNSLLMDIEETVNPIFSMAKEEKTTVNFQGTDDYIKHAIGEVSGLITSIDMSVNAKLAEKEEYRKQKEQYAELELKAEKEHKKMLEERAHAEKMKAYLENEQGEKTKTEEVVKVV